MRNDLLHFPERLGPRARLLVAVSVLWAAPVLACGSFAPRPTPTPTLPAPVVLPDTAATNTPEPLVIVDATPTLSVTAALPTTPLTATQPTTQTTAPPAPAGNVLAAGAPARVTAPDGLNMRSAASPSGTLIVQLATGARVTVLEGPVQAENFTWWRVDNGAGQTGWVAEGDGDTVWLSPQIGEPQAVDRSPRVGDRVTVSTLLSIRATPGTGRDTTGAGAAQHTVHCARRPAERRRPYLVPVAIGRWYGGGLGGRRRRHHPLDLPLRVTRLRRCALRRRLHTAL